MTHPEKHTFFEHEIPKSRDYWNSSSVIALSHAIQERVRESLFASQKSGKAFFDELLSVLSYIPRDADYSHSQKLFRGTFPQLFHPKDEIHFYFPETTLERIHLERERLTTSEKQTVLQDIETELSKQSEFYTHLRSALIYLKNTLQVSYTPSLPPKEEQLRDAEIISLSDILAGPGERTRFYEAENKNQNLTKRITGYQLRIISGIWSLTDKNFAQVHDTLFQITQTLLTTRWTPEFSQDELYLQIEKLSEFECQFFIQALEKALFPKAYSSQMPRMKILQEIQDRLETRKKSLQGMNSNN